MIPYDCAGVCRPEETNIQQEKMPQKRNSDDENLIQNDSIDELLRIAMKNIGKQPCTPSTSTKGNS